MAGDVPSPLEPQPERESRRRARTWWWAAGAFAILVAVAMMWLGRQNSSAAPAPKAFCKAAERYEAELERQQRSYERDVARQIRFVVDIAATAPGSVRADAQLFLESLRRVEAAPTKKAREKIQDDPEIREAVDNVNRRWNQGCGVFDRQSGI